MELSQFLIQAKQNIYASKEESGVTFLDDGTKETIYTGDRFHYRDRSFGFNPFIGEQLVWEAGRLIWGMNYFGKAIEEMVPASQVYTFLQQALYMARPDRPYRGPEYFRAGPFSYVDKSHGVLDDFTGEEVIYFRDQQVYHLVYHGGRIDALEKSDRIDRI
ncbi:MAG: DUF5680 domain-containing protein [Methanomicrobiales archaeon]|nr:DUF5680 domain-containing protein [Methanomicrobiales archaeon]